MTTEPSLLVISGLDPGGGAGFIADIRVAAAHGLRAIGVVTALTEQDTAGVRAANPVPAGVVADQLRAILWDIEVAAVKIGMLGSEAVAEAVAEALHAVAAPVVWDPVLRPTAGRVPLYDGDPARAAALLAGHVTVMTPNAPEAAVLWGRDIEDVATMRRAAGDLCARMGAAVLVKGGHLGGAEAVDVLATADQVQELRGPRLAVDRPVHGTGCALSTALACGLAAGQELAAAARSAKHFVAGRIGQPRRPGRGAPSVM
jgi:hydroxymethylpyrimidine/phosphomethylpyrimidine kinase